MIPFHTHKDCSEDRPEALEGETNGDAVGGPPMRMVGEAVGSTPR